MKNKPNASRKTPDARRLADVSERVRIRLDLETLETRNSDSLDFHGLSVASIRDVIQMVFDAGYDAGLAAKSRPETPPANPNQTTP